MLVCWIREFTRYCTKRAIVGYVGIALSNFMHVTHMYAGALYMSSSITSINGRGVFASNSAGSGGGGKSLNVC